MKPLTNKSDDPTTSPKDEPKTIKGVASSELLEIWHATSPFMTSKSGGGEYAVNMKFKTLKDAQKMHDALCNFFSANAEDDAYSAYPNILNNKETL